MPSLQSPLSGTTMSNKTRLNPLLEAAKNGDAKQIKKLLNEGLDCHCIDQDERTILHHGASSGSISVMMSALSKGAGWYIGKTSKTGMTPLHDAALGGHAKVVHLLLALGADFTAHTKQGFTPLLCAAGNGMETVTRILLAAGSDADEVIEPAGVNALHIASWTGQSSIVQILVDSGADISIPSRADKTALMYAIEENHEECIQLLTLHNGNNHLQQPKTFSESHLRAKIKQNEEKVKSSYDQKLYAQRLEYERKIAELQIRYEEEIDTLKKEISRLCKALGEEHALKKKLSLTRSMPLDKEKSSLLARRALLRRSETLPQMPVTKGSTDSDSDHLDEAEDEFVSFSPGPLERTRRTGKGKLSMLELVEKTEQKKNASVLSTGKSPDSLNSEKSRRASVHGYHQNNSRYLTTPNRSSSESTTPSPPSTSPNRIHGQKHSTSLSVKERSRRLSLSPKIFHKGKIN